MNSLDLFIILLCIAMIGRGFHIGALRQAASIGGFFAGLYIGSVLAPQVTGLVDSEMSRTLVALLVTVGLGLSVGSAAEVTAIRIRDKIKHPPIQKLESFLGSIFSIAAVLVTSWLVSSMLFRLPFADINAQIERSKIINYMNAKLPPAPSVVSRIGNIISPNGFPKVFVEGEPQLRATGPADAAVVQRAAEKGRASTVKIEGFGCGGVAVGSGVIIGTNLIATNAHVIAGVRQPTVIHNGTRLTATPVWFNPDSDFAVLRVNRVIGPVLQLTVDSVPRGTSAAILGYPGGGPLTISPTVVLGERIAVGRDIYNQSIVARRIYEVVSDVRPGNSGGPMVLEDGTIAGIVFASSVGNEGFGYVLTADEVRDQIAEASNRGRVGTGMCTES